MPKGHPKRTCSATSQRTHHRCRQPCVPGAEVCRYHGGAAPQVAKRAMVRAELTAWGLTDAKVDPGETLLRLVAQSARRAQFYASLLERAYAGDDGVPAELAGAGLRALVGHRHVLGPEGVPVAVAEDLRGLVRLEAEERDRCARFAKLAVDAGIAEREVAARERWGREIAFVLERVLDQLPLSAEQRVAARPMVAAELRVIEGEASVR